MLIIVANVPASLFFLIVVKCAFFHQLCVSGSDVSSPEMIIITLNIASNISVCSDILSYIQH